MECTSPTKKMNDRRKKWFAQSVTRLFYEVWVLMGNSAGLAWETRCWNFTLNHHADARWIKLSARVEETPFYVFLFQIALSLEGRVVISHVISADGAWSSFSPCL